MKEFKGLRVTVMGLGLHGGGLQSALFLARHGADVTVTDLRDEKVLAPSLARLAGFPVSFVLGRHEERLFSDTDLVVKNPGVPKDSPFLATAKSSGIPIETDISLFLSLSSNPIIAVTGSKGKSTVASAIHYCLAARHKGARLGGNITVSPLGFVETLLPEEPVVLELSSWQLADLAGKAVLKPGISVITNIFPDHMNYYHGMDDYIADKKIIYRNQDAADSAVFNNDCPVTASAFADCRAQRYFFSKKPFGDEKRGAWMEGKQGIARIGDNKETLFDTAPLLKGSHNRMNLLCAGLACLLAGLDTGTISERLAGFPGIEHRLEAFLEHKGVIYYNDSAATIPHATIHAIRGCNRPLVLITGGTDKNIDFAPLLDVIGECEKIVLLAGTATNKLTGLLDEAGILFEGPYDELEKAVNRAVSFTSPGTSLLFSPGCASFGMFLNEFDRGRKFKAAVRKILGIKEE
ncbi:MAG: UDP-N-acetylmuramoyl-L-alanine--D-glutamate ligase [Spirochaetales bacterium]|nr:UDP-N-acetylmuramoyl-L-alanine--D-glutamate ligase [Spirochaetales bacterium]